MTRLSLDDLYMIRPVVCQCLKCQAIFHSEDVTVFLGYGSQPTVPRSDCQPCQRGHVHKHPTCPVCGVQYIPTTAYHWANLFEYLIKHTRPTWPFSPLNQAALPAFLHHCWRFGQSIVRIENDQVTPLMGLLKVLAEAQSFVHFVSCSALEREVIGALLMLAHELPIRGVIAPQSTHETHVFNLFGSRMPYLDARTYTHEAPFSMTSYDHTFIVDGIIAVRANFSASSHETRTCEAKVPAFTVIAELEGVTALNNEFFSPVWAQESNYGDVIVMR